MNFLKWIRSLSLIKQICVGMATVLAVGGSATTVAVVANQKPQKQAVVATTESSQEPESEEEQIEEAIHYSSMKISVSSIEKDLDIFFLDENNNKIKGQPFSVKLVAVKDAEKLNSYVEKISDLNKEIKEAEDIVSGSTAASVVASKPATSSSAPSSAASSAATPSSESTGLLVADARSEAQKKLVELGKQKVEALEEYKDALKDIDGKVYTDDNQDGRITEKKLTPGDFSLCYVPTNDYETAEYTQKTTVKDKVEYKPVQNIEEKKVTVEEAGDAQPVHEVVEESKAKDTVEYVESRKEGDTGEYKESSVRKLSSTPGAQKMEHNVTVNDNVVLYSGLKDLNSVSFGLSATGYKIKDEDITSNTSGLTASYDGNKLTVKADGISETTTGTITIKVPKSNTTQTPNEGTQGGNTGGDGSNTGGDGGNTGGDGSNTGGNGGNTGGDGSNSGQQTTTEQPTTTPETTTEQTTTEPTTTQQQTQTPASSQQPKEEYEYVTITVTIHGSSEQLKDSQGRELFKDDEGKQKATVSDYDPNGKYFYEFKKPGEAIYYGWQNINGIQYYYDKNGKKVTGPQVILGVKYNFGTDGALLTGGVGIDVSKWQGNINWAEAKSAISFAIIRAGFRGTAGGIAEDPYAVTNLKGCNANGIKCGLYFYSRATTEAEAVEEASLAIAVAKKGSISLPIYFDMESPENKTAEDKDAIVMAFCRTVQAAGYSAGLYASKNWINNYLNPSSYSGVSIWVAQYAESCSYGGHYDMWQYSSKGSVPGISTSVDMNQSHF